MAPSFLGLALLTLTQATPEPADHYVERVKPVLRQRCYSCHGALKQESGLRLDTADAIRRGGDGGPVVEPGDAQESELLRRVTSEDEFERMPPEGAPLTVEQINDVRQWVRRGAKGPENERAEAAPREHWAFRPPQRPHLKESSEGETSRHPIDRLLQRQRDSRGVKTSAPAAKGILLRRLYLDLIGLPPTREELDEFARDDRPDAYARVVDRLLDSPHHGERWGRHWMDVWRYSDWYGLGEQLRFSQKHIWHWRDWIVESLNEDKGYDRIVVQMLAADELDPLNHDALRGTGFLARNYYLFNRTTWLDNTIEHTSKALLGLTLNCAKCHDHKYDPLTQEDYYRMRAIFEPHQVRMDPLPGQTDLAKDGLPRAFDAHPEMPTYLHVRGDEKNPDKSRAIEPGIPKVLETEPFRAEPIDLPAEAHDPAVQPFVLKDHLDAAEREIRSAEKAWSEAESLFTEQQDSAEQQDSTEQENSTEQQDSADRIEKARLARDLAAKTLEAAKLRPVMLEAAHEADLVKHTEPSSPRLTALVHWAAVVSRRYEWANAEVRVLRSRQALSAAKEKASDENTDEVKQAGKELAEAEAALAKAETAVQQPGDQYTSLRVSRKAAEGPDEKPESLNKPYSTKSSGRRTALARWIVRRDNPLTARVAVNHIWMRHFGQPLVEPVTDFGRRTEPPVQQELLDWLAVELMESGWSMKHVHRLIVTSRAYRLASSTLDAKPESLANDPENQFYWRRLPSRMEAEVIRDSLLRLAGVLDPTLGGPTIDPQGEDDKFRRSLYFTRSRDDENPFLSMFDQPDILRCYRRTESIVPQQALTMANSKLALTMAREMAKRWSDEPAAADSVAVSVTTDAPQASSEDEFVRATFFRLLCRPPDDDELNACREMLARTTEHLSRSQSVDQAASRARANLVHALLNHNDFITIR